MSANSLAMPKSLWAATGAPAPATPALASDTRVDVAIVGAGYTGITTALHLAAAGTTVCVLDAGEPGWGASGRNGGQVIPGLKYDPDDLAKMFGARAEAIIEVAGHAADEVFRLIDHYGIECDAVRNGWIQPAFTPTAMRAIENRARQWQRRGVPVEILDATATAKRIGSQAYLGAWVDPRAGSVHPLNFIRGLTRAALQHGAQIHGQTRVVGLKREGERWTLTTAQGNRVTAQRVVLATDGYSDDLWPGLKQTVIAANSFIVSTPPLPEDIAQQILPQGEVCSDSRRLLLYYKKDAAGRFLLGGRGPFSEPKSHNDFNPLKRAVTSIFPQLQGVGFEHHWSGRVGLTRDFLPHVHEPEPGLSILLGYNGRGIAMSTTLAKHLSQRILGTTQALPFPITRVDPIPFHSLQRLYLGAGIAWYRMLDAIA
ncbi:NAD(P)/FAD-dependent oxidoreductase [Pseudomonas sp. K1(2024)]|uniref:NAD(P)/FAD-dependent oxidoreductase n=1 Tax=Pseudomonas boreofloridensis TaxID=3064348 RepID=A0ABV4Z6Z9_9PSED|nr:FAD-binding oxidoreductase [Pseudomonas sp. K13]MDO7902260.1 FAD-binding oxidoreductase [Pseudomonas sp. K13]